MKVHLVDGTFELFRAYFGAPAAVAPDGGQVGATIGIMRSMLSLLADDGVSHVGIAFDHVIESFRNDLYGGYKTGDGIEPDLMSQFPLAERAMQAIGVVVWPMVEFEADDALAAAAAKVEPLPEVEQVVICSPDKDLAQCVRGTRVVCFDRMRRRMLDEAGVVEKFGVPPASIPDWLALVGDDSDGYPGIPRWGARSAAAVLAHYRHLEAIPDDASRWTVAVRGAAGLAQTLRDDREAAMLYRRLATLRVDVPLEEDLDGLRWRGARRPELTRLCEELGDQSVIERVQRWQEPID